MLLAIEEEALAVVQRKQARGVAHRILYWWWVVNSIRWLDKSGYEY